MKSVSFSDLRDSSRMNSLDSNIKKSSSIKQLTYYTSSEDILRRFSTKTSDKSWSKECQKIPDNRIETVTKAIIEPIIDELEETKMENTSQTTSHDRTIKDLQDQLRQKVNTIADLQDENLLLKNESTKNREQVKYLENRIKYLENLVDTFNSNSQNKSQETNERNDYSGKENTGKMNSQTPAKTKPLNSRVNFEGNPPVQERNQSNYVYKSSLNSDTMPIQDRTTDLKKRPNSADSTLQNNFPISTNYFTDESYNQTRQYSLKPYDSDSEPNRSYKYIQKTSNNDTQSSGSVNYINVQRQKLEKDRSTNLAEFKSRLDEFTNYARKSAEQNSLRNSTSILPIPNEYKLSQKSSSNSDKWIDSNTKNRMKSSTQFSRPPVDPCYKQRRNNIPDSKLSTDLSTMNYFTLSQSAIDEDTNLKERVKKILEKHNYPSNNCYYGNTNDNIGANISDNIGYRDESMNTQFYKKYSSNDTSKPILDRRYPTIPMQYETIPNNKMLFNDSHIPRLDLTLYHQASYQLDEEIDLIDKYLNYQGYANVS